MKSIRLPLILLLIPLMLNAGVKLSKLPADLNTQNGKTIFDGIKKINGMDIYCKVIGSGEPLLIVHGGPGLSHEYLFPPFNTLADNYKLIFYDQRGCGKSQAFNIGDTTTINTMVEDLEALRKEFLLDKLNLVGQSWGAVISLNYTLKYPANVKKLLLLEPAPGSGEYLDQIQKMIVKRLTEDQMKKLSQISQSPELRTNSELFKEFMNIRMKTYYYDTTFAEDKKFDYFDNEMVTKFFASSAKFGPYLLNFNLYEQMKYISCPTLIIHGDYDVIPNESIERMAKEIKNSELHIIKKCGHFVHIEKPEEYFSTIISFLQKNE